MAELSRFGAVILAAGLSSRMGGGNKLLKTFHGTPLLCHALETVAALGFKDAVVVTGRDAAAVSTLVHDQSLRSVFNEGYRSGMGSSIAVGVAVLDRAIDGIFIVLGDMPHVRRQDFVSLAEALTPGSIAIPRYGSQRGHPALFASVFRDDLRALQGDSGGRFIISRHPGSVVEVPSENPGILADYDSESDFQSASSFPGM